MARMYPEFGPREFEEASHEDEIYWALEKLPEEYIVIHSFKYAYQHNFKYQERESDFVIYHKDLGILCVEAKGGNIKYQNSWWYYQSGKEFEHDPYDQASKAMWELVKKIKYSAKDGGLEIAKCCILSAVWFPSITRRQLNTYDLPSNALPQLTFTFDDIDGTPEALDRKIKNVFKTYGSEGIWNHTKREYIPDPITDLSEDDEKLIFRKVLLPQFDMIELPSVRCKWAETKFIQLLESQKRILDFLTDQRTAVINGAAGTGKTLIAIEKAVRLAESGEKVLLLCFNGLLRDDIERKINERCAGNLVEVRTVSSLALEKTSSVKDFSGLNAWLERYGKSFGLKHVIIDEGQDFGRPEIESSGLLDTLCLLTQEHEDGTFYVFYDQRQLVHNASLPESISNSDCKMTLYVNCRNTKNISDCSVNGLKKDKQKKNPRKVLNESVAGDPPKFHFDENKRGSEAFVDEQIKLAKENGFEASRMVVLSCRTLDESSEYRTRHMSKVVAGKNRQRTWGSSKVPFYSCREYKGLEADVVFLVDVDREVWEQDHRYQAPPGNLFYTSASRAKFQLFVAAEMTEKDAADIADILEGPDSRHQKKPYLKLQNILRKGL